MDEDERLIRLASAQHGLVAASQLRSLGLGDHAFLDRARGRHWDAVTDEVLRRTGTAQGRSQLAMTAVLDAGAGAVLSHSSAASWWGLRSCDLSPVHVTRDVRSTRRPAAGVLHTVRSLPHEWLTTLDAVPIVRPELLAMQLFAQLRPGAAERRVDALWSLRLTSGPALSRFLGQLGARGRNGVAGLRRYLEVRGDSYIPPASGLEGRAREVIAAAGIPMRAEVHLGGERWDGRVDLLHECLPLVVEIQSERYHAALCDRRADEDRVRRLTAAGFEVVEVWDTQVWHRPHEVVSAVRDGERRARARSVLQNRTRTRSSAEQNGGGKI